MGPFQELGISPSASEEEIRFAYHALARQWHPDRFQDADEQEVAQQKMIAINRAYEDALRMISVRSAPYNRELDCEDAIRLAQKMLSQRGPESALRQLMRATHKNAEWYYLQGSILMQMEQYDSAHQSYREAVRMEPENMTFRRGALDAAVTMKKAKTLKGKLQHLFTGKVR